VIEVESSNLSGVDYDDWSGTLTIAFHGGRVYRYFGVPYSIFDGLMSAESHGKYFHAHIRDKYRFRRIA
jgi:hypothetical protein